MPITPDHQQQQKANLRLALILASLALVFGLAFAAKIWLSSP